jgi:hypothetical protein
MSFDCLKGIVNPDSDDWPEMERRFNSSQYAIRRFEAEQQAIGKSLVLFFTSFFTIHKAWINGWVLVPGEGRFVPSRGRHVLSRQGS